MGANKNIPIAGKRPGIPIPPTANNPATSYLSRFGIQPPIGRR